MNTTPKTSRSTSDTLSLPALKGEVSRVKSMNVNSEEYLKMSSSGSSKKNPSKYNAKKVRIDGILFDSKLEGNRYLELKQLLSLGVISDLETHKKYPLIVNNLEVTTYEADFVYKKEGIEIVEDTKGFLTKEYKIKKKLMKAIYDKDIMEVYSKKKK